MARAVLFSIRSFASIVLPVVLLAGLAAAPAAHAQSDDGPGDETLFGDVRSSGGYGAPTVALTRVHGETAVLLGGQGGWVVNRQFVIGAAGRGLATLPDASIVTIPELEVDPQIQLGYGGLLLEYIGAPSRLVHYGAELVVGGGSAQLVPEDFEPRDDDTIDRTGVFAGEVGARVEVNLTSYFRLGLSGGYRLISGSDLLGVSDSDLSAPYGQLSLRFGSF
jgi:hypothetical protein